MIIIIQLDAQFAVDYLINLSRRRIYTHKKRKMGGRGSNNQYIIELKIPILIYVVDLFYYPINS